MSKRPLNTDPSRPRPILPWSKRILSCLLLLACGKLAQAAPLETVKNLDLERYLGVWYEVARFPNRFEKDCVGVRAIYTRQSEDRIGVTNECRKYTVTGDLRKIEGRARVPDKNQPSKLEVSFFWFFWSDYWVIMLGDNYEYAVVSEPDREYLWILSRTPQMPEPLYQELIEKLKAKEFDTSKIIRVAQPEGESVTPGESSTPRPSETR